MFVTKFLPVEFEGTLYNSVWQEFWKKNDFMDLVSKKALYFSDNIIPKRPLWVWALGISLHG